MIGWRFSNAYFQNDHGWQGPYRLGTPCCEANDDYDSYQRCGLISQSGPYVDVVVEVVVVIVLVEVEVVDAILRDCQRTPCSSLMMRPSYRLVLESFKCPLTLTLFAPNARYVPEYRSSRSLRRVLISLVSPCRAVSRLMRA
jgi:hypothetical protein